MGWKCECGQWVAHMPALARHWVDDHHQSPKDAGRDLIKLQQQKTRERTRAEEDQHRP